MKDNCNMQTHINLVEVGIDKCPYCKLKLLTKEEYSN